MIGIGDLGHVALQLVRELGAEVVGGTWVDPWEVLQLHAAGRLSLKTEVHALESVNDVLEKLRQGEVTGRAVLVPG